MKPTRYIPERGDVIWITLNPQAGHEQAGRCPAVVLSPGAYNRKVGLAILCPITQQVRGYPFEVKIPEDGSIKGVVLADQVKSLDWRARKSEFAEKLSPTIVNAVLEKLNMLLFK